MQPLRSLLYVPANRREWILDAPTQGADGFIFDLEDAVPAGEKAEARATLGSALDEIDAANSAVAVRVNPPDTGFFEEDLDAVAGSDVDALVLPKLETAEDVRRVDHLLTYLERLRGVDERVEIVALPETAQGFRNAYELCAASDRVAALVGATIKGADVQRALGFEWTPEGDERQYMLSKLAMDGRAGGVSQLLAGPWHDIEDEDGLRAEALRCRQLGFTGYQVIHPSHVEPVNEIFSPDPKEVERCRDLLDAVGDADARDSGAIRYEGEMIDVAHVRRARDVVERAEAFDG